MNNKKISVCLSLLLTSVVGHAELPNPFKNHFYIGAMGGVGSTTWQGLVPSQQNQNGAISMSTPIGVEEGGQSWGLLGGFEINPFFALEANYIHFPKATIGFDTNSLFFFNNDGLTYFESNTEAFSVMGKIMMFVPDTKMRMYSSFGVANIHRQDMILNDWRVGPTFGVGLNYHITDRLTGELGGTYATGYGESQLNPSDTFFPFLYSVTLRLAYYF